MEQLGVSYRDDDKGVNGCVSKYLNKMLKDYRTAVKDGMAGTANCIIKNVVSNTPDGVVDVGPKPKKDSPIFWVSMKTDTHQMVPKVKGWERQEKVDMVHWKKVSGKTKI